MRIDEVTPGLRVRVCGQPDRTGTITTAAPIAASGVTRVQVAFDGASPTWVRVENLERLPEQRDIFAEFAGGLVSRPDALRRNLLHEKLQGRLSTLLYSMEASKTQFLAFQFKPVLKLLDSPTNGILIADEVGLGKTIEAGLIWTELVARTGASRLLVVCPPHLREKWRLELIGRFGVRAQIARNADEVLHELSDASHSPGRCFALIASYQTLRPPRSWEDQEPAERNARSRLAHFLHAAGNGADPLIDLLVIDEAHYMRNPQALTSRLGDLLSPVAAHRVFLSATPMMIRTGNLFTLLRLLDPDTFTDERSFQDILGANEPLVRLRDRILGAGSAPAHAEVLGLIDQALTHPLLTDNNGLRSLRESIGNDASSLERTSGRSQLACQVERVNLLGQLVTRSRKRDVFQNRLVREVDTVRVPMSDVEARFYHSVTELVLRYAEKQGIGAGFLTVMPQRQVSSCMPAALRSWLEGLPLATEEDVAPDLTGDLDEDATQERPLIGFLSAHLGGHFSVTELEESDTKYASLLDTLRRYWASNPENKVVLFAYFKPTLSYLRERLAEDGIPSLLLTGDIGQPKQDVVDAFRENDFPKLLLSSEVGGEGLDIQFASALINYDLPWNPMVVEQRIGRLDRIGQAAERILIFNLIRSGTIDERIYDRLFLRLDMFRRTLGDLEEVIGPIIARLTNDLLVHSLTEVQVEERLQRTEMALANGLADMAKLEEEAAVLAAYGDYIIQQINASHTNNRWVQGRDIEAYVIDCLSLHYPKTRVRGIDPGDRSFEIELDPDAHFDFCQFLEGNRLLDRTHLNTLDPRRIRFDHRMYAGRAGGEEVVHVAHPLVRFVGRVLSDRASVAPVAVTACLPAEVLGGDVPPGTYAFVVQRWTVVGLRASEVLRHVVLDVGGGGLLDADGIAERFVEAVADAGRPWLDVQWEIADLPAVVEQVRRMEMDATNAFFAFVAASEAENRDRAEIQRRAVDRFQARRETVLEEVAARHQAADRESLYRATMGQLRNLRERSDVQRRRIEEKAQVDEDFRTLAIGLVRVDG